MSSHLSHWPNNWLNFTGKKKTNKLWNECLIDFEIYCSANWLQYAQHNCYCHCKTNNNREQLTLAHTAIKVEGVNNSNNNLIIVNTWKQCALSIMLHNYVPLLKYKYWIKITIISTNCNNSKRINNKQIRFGVSQLFGAIQCDYA